jgi:hypothetical protein
VCEREREREMGFLCDRVSQTISPGWLGTTILLISVSWVGRITGVRHRLPPLTSLYNFYMLIKRKNIKNKVAEEIGGENTLSEP